MSKVTYAQSSDIKSRSFSEYRHDMKKKGVRELEFLDYLRDRLIERYRTNKVTVHKHGNDAKLWFLRSGGQPSQAPDYIATITPQRTVAEQVSRDIPGKYLIPDRENTELFEFQLANKEGLESFDFKVSKVGYKPRGGARKPHEDREFFYVIAEENKFAFLSPSWILENGKEENVPAWRSPGIRINRENFLTQFQEGGDELELVLRTINDKLILLEYQKTFLEREAKRLSQRLQRVIEDNIEFTIIPRTLNGIYEVCFLMDKLNKSPDSANVWLVYLSSFPIKDMSSIDFARYMYAFDFIYFKCEDFQDNELLVIKQMISNSTQKIRHHFDSNNQEFKTNANESLMDTIRHFVFSVNLLEDIRQDGVVIYDLNIPAVNRIFETIPNIKRTVETIESFETVK